MQDSLKVGDQTPVLDLVANLRFLSANNGPIMWTSTKGLNVPLVTHFKLFAERTVKKRESRVEEG